ncbi:arylformamidase [Planomicrobium stackebrandtii]|uniref:Arylformamidase n=1 Tax=Planomicrobium stackebrandtii TaxID=253160 RepID=A0ABU0GXW6_9BACL|nr:arylformamidase [Planomicrobium stackebrandtii]MDQ0430216.1 arylformamidase [Planomicrobium stackebrandtii]
MEPKNIIDISMELSNGTPEWPGDMPFSYELSVTKEQSGSVNVGKLQSSTHVGTHVDAPFHYDDDGIKIDELPLDIYLSKAQVVDVSGLSTISAADLVSLEEGVTTLLLKTVAWKDRSRFPETWPVFDESIAKWMEDNGVKLLGVDVPSVDPETSKELPMHQAMNRHQRFILEGIVLDDVAEGVYRLAALPLKIKGAEGSPVRAILYT